MERDGRFRAALERALAALFAAVFIFIFVLSDLLSFFFNDRLNPSRIQEFNNLSPFSSEQV